VRRSWAFQRSSSLQPLLSTFLYLSHIPTSPAFVECLLVPLTFKYSTNKSSISDFANSLHTLNLLIQFRLHIVLTIFSFFKISKVQISVPHGIFALTYFPLLMTLRILATSSNDGLSDGSSAQHCFIRVNMSGCTPADSSRGSSGR